MTPPPVGYFAYQTPRIVVSTLGGPAVRFRRFAPLIGIGALVLAAVFMATARGAAAAGTPVAYSFDAASRGVGERASPRRPGRIQEGRRRRAEDPRAGPGDAAARGAHPLRRRRGRPLGPVRCRAGRQHPAQPRALLLRGRQAVPRADRVPVAAVAGPRAIDVHHCALPADDGEQQDRRLHRHDLPAVPSRRTTAHAGSIAASATRPLGATPSASSTPRRWRPGWRRTR
jgi:hypothetical protein